MNNSDDSLKISALGLFIWLLVATFFLYEFFLRTFVGSLSHQIIPALHLNVETFAIIGSAYYLAYGIMQVPVGILTDKFGVKKLIIFAVLICAGATFLFAHSHGFMLAFLSRILMGFGSSFAFVCLLVTAMNWFPQKNFAFFVGASQFIGTMGPVLAGGPLVSFISTSHLSWRTALDIVSLFGVGLAVIFLLFMKNKSKTNKNTLVYIKRKSSLTQSLKHLLSSKQVWLIAIYSGTSYAAVALLGAIWGTAFLQTRGLSQTYAAYMVSLAWIGYAVGCPLVGALSDAIKRRKSSLVLCSLLGVFVTSGIIFLKFHHDWVYGILFFLLGIAGSGQNIGFATISEQASPENRASALGLNNAALIFFDSVLPPLVGFFIYASAGQAASHQIKLLMPENFMLGFSLMPILYAVGMLIALFFIKETYCKPQKEIIIISG